ncbi:hypothetical protein, partial [Klebsiella aerogenes]|uniref:hypothetical protein n=1 Tax=Klebsiella aerogenes TaxID=548 RepID=UPI0019536DC2
VHRCVNNVAFNLAVNQGTQHLILVPVFQFVSPVDFRRKKPRVDVPTQGQCQKVFSPSYYS